MHPNPLPPPPRAILTGKNLLNMIHDMVGTKLFQHFYVIDHTGQEIDASEGGNLSCAQVVSGILVLNDLMERIRATVPTCLKDMEASGWYKTDQPAPGSVIHWAANGNGHEHLGFYIDEHTAMSNSSQQGVPVLQGLNMPDGRPPIAFYTHPNLPKRLLSQ